jgi:hypothetical protein
MTAAQIPAPANTQRLTMKPSEIRPGDWLRDLGRLRQVGDIGPVDTEVVPSTLYLIRFVDQPDCDFGTMGVREETPVTVWREP